MKRTDKYPPPTPEDVERVAANRSTRKVHPLLWVVFAVVVVIGVGLYSDLVGFYEFEEIEEMISKDDQGDDHSDDHKNDDNGDQDNGDQDKGGQDKGGQGGGGPDQTAPSAFGKRGWVPDRTYAPAEDAPAAGAQ